MIDHERMYADLSKDLPNAIKIVHVPKSGGSEALTPAQEGDYRRDLIHRVNFIIDFLNLKCKSLVFLWHTSSPIVSTFLRIHI